MYVCQLVWTNFRCSVSESGENQAPFLFIIFKFWIWNSITVHPGLAPAMDLSQKDFHHPYSPYDIQIRFMRALYTCIEERKVGIFESPTGKPITSQPGLSLLRSAADQLLGTVRDGVLQPFLTALRWSIYIASLLNSYGASFFPVLASKLCWETMTSFVKNSNWLTLLPSS